MLTCENHPNLRWHCKMQAVNKDGRYTGARNIFFTGKYEGDKFFREYEEDSDGNMVKECSCPGSLLIATDMEYVRKWHEDNKY